MGTLDEAEDFAPRLGHQRGVDREALATPFFPAVAGSYPCGAKRSLTAMQRVSVLAPSAPEDLIPFPEKGTEIKQVRAQGGCLGTDWRRRTWQAAISRGELHASFDPWISEWGNPAGVMPGHPVVEHMDRGKRTEGTETSKYLEEERTTVIP